MDNGDFFSLGPEKVLDTVEAALGVRATGRAFALNSLENRVYDIELEDGSRIVTKFYRPGRWSAEQILEEHLFLHRLAAVEIPVVVPFPLRPAAHLVTGETESFATLGKADGIFFAAFARNPGRILNELDDAKLRTLGRLVARIHEVGSAFPGEFRLDLNAETYGRAPLEFLQKEKFLDDPMGQRYLAQAESLVEIIEALLSDVPTIAVHGDCHLGNTLWLDDRPFFLDFDDLIYAPPVQDIWMIVRGRDAEAVAQRDILIEAYEEFRDFDRSSLSLIEPLRALRMIHFSAWIAKRWQDPSFPQCFPNFGTAAYWREEISALAEIEGEITGVNR